MAAAKKGSKSNGKTNGLPKMVWINYDLTSEDKRALQDQNLVREILGYDIGDLAVEGFKYSLSPDERNNCYVASLTQKRADSPFHHHCLTGRGSTPTNARLSLLYRHLVLASGDWSFFSQPDDETPFDIF